jgi:hypothetical protein
MAINASSGGQLQGGSNGPGSGGGLTEEDVQDIVASQIEVGTDINIGLQTSYDDATGKLVISLAGATNSGGTAGTIGIKEDGTARGSATILNFVGPSVDVVDNVATITGGLDSVTIYENASNRGNFTNINFVSGASVSVNNGTANVTIEQPTVPETLTDLGITDGTNGQVLTTDGNGNFSFTTLNTSGGGGGSYTLPVASGSTLGGIKLGTGLSIDGSGVVSVTGGSSFSGNYNDLTNKPTIPPAYTAQVH